ncbi:MAG: type VI secretion system lipoprotein TssJ [Methylococcaceae bacterium]|jgi:type VI secretion system VasD/TssJ family lipoprotein
MMTKIYCTMRLLGLTAALAVLCSCGGIISSAAPDVLSAVDVAERLSAVATNTTTIPTAAEIAEAQSLPALSTPLPAALAAAAGQPAVSYRLPQVIPINLHASDYLNVDAKGQPLALITKIYKLKQYEAFQQASYETFLDPQKEKEVLGADLIEVKETTLIPGQHYQTKEKVTRDTDFIGVVGLFRAPTKGYWRATLPIKSVARTGITIGMLGCTLTVGTGETIKINNQFGSARAPCQEESTNKINQP